MALIIERRKAEPREISARNAHNRGSDQDVPTTRSETEKVNGGEPLSAEASADSVASEAEGSGRNEQRTLSNGDTSYRVGNKRPPIHGQFNGRSGNPKGRPKGSVSFTTRINQELRKVVTVMKGGKPVKMTKKDIITEQLVDSSMNKNLKATLVVMQHEEKEAARIHNSVEGGNFKLPNKDNMKFILSRLSRLVDSGEG